MAERDFTLAQVDDLAHYFLGKDWFGMQLRGQVMLSSNGHGVHVGQGWREVFRAAGVQLPLRPQYVAQGVRVMFSDRAICTAVSNTLAKRIAAALNEHIPDRRGI
jgi:hypothetical protein